MRLDKSLPGVMTSGGGLDTPCNDFLPNKVANVSKDVLRAFPHTKRVGNYLLGKTLGEGSFAKVKEAMHTLTGEKVAIKVIDKKKAKADAYVRKNLRREGKLLQTVRHENVISLFEIMETENSYYLVTELCQGVDLMDLICAQKRLDEGQGGDLMDLICAQKRLDESQARRYTRQIISAIDYLHKAGILHRDLKVENLLLDHNKDIKIIDFGLSNSVRVSHTKEGGSQAQEYCVTQCGSPAYAAPELLGNKKYGPKVDIWSIGVNMYAMLTGNLPFTVEPFNIKALHKKMLNSEINPIPEHLSNDCKDLLLRLLTPTPEERITLHAAMRHPWITQAATVVMEPAHFPNKLSSDDLNHDIVKHMAANMEYRMSEVIRLATKNIPNNATATYHLFLRKLRRYQATVRSAGDLEGSRGNTPSSSKQLIQRRSANAGFKASQLHKASTLAVARHTSRESTAARRRGGGDTATTPVSGASSPSKASVKSPRKSDASSASEAEKTLVRRRIKNARVLATMHGEEERAKTGSKIQDGGGGSAGGGGGGGGGGGEERGKEGSGSSGHNVEEADAEVFTAKASNDEDSDGRGGLSRDVFRRFTEDFVLEDMPTTGPTSKPITLPRIDPKTLAAAKPPTSASTTEQNPASSSTRESSVSTSASSQEDPHSSDSISHKSSGQKSAQENKASLSDPSTQLDKTIMQQNRPTAKQVVLDMGSYSNKCSKDRDAVKRSLPTVTTPRSYATSSSRTEQTPRRVVNIYSSGFNSNRTLSRPSVGASGGGVAKTTAAARRSSLSRNSVDKSLNVLGERAAIGRTAGFSYRASLNSFSHKLASHTDRGGGEGVRKRVTLPVIQPYPSARSTQQKNS